MEGVPLKRGRLNPNFLTTRARHMKFSGLAKMKKRSNVTKFGDTKIKGVPLKRGHQTSNFLTTHARHMKFSK